MMEKKKRKGILWVQGTFENYLITFPADKDWSVSIGSNAWEGPTMLIESKELFYLYVWNIRDRDCDYEVLLNFEAPVIRAFSGMEFKYGNEVFRLI